METALAESGAKMTGLQKYESMVDKTQPEMMFPKTEEPIESKWVPISVPPPQASPFPPQGKPCLNTQPHASPPPALVASQATPQAKPTETNASVAQEEKDKLELYSLGKAISQQANVTEYLIKNHKAWDFRSTTAWSRRGELGLPFVCTFFRYFHPFLTRNRAKPTRLCNVITISVST